VGCGRIAPKPELVRIALSRTPRAGARAVLDLDGKMPGRGAYLCRDQRSERPVAACVERARRNGGVARTLRAAVRIDGELLESVG
jgi:predicted RNA-binding protein YlxR (DUF448 family)